MRISTRTATAVLACALLVHSGLAAAQDWPQWRGKNRDAKAAGFDAPAAWPKELAQEWKVPVGQGDATPALVGQRLYVFARQEGSEVIRCLDAATGDEIWQDKYESQGATGPAGGHAGPRASPAVADGKVVTLGVRGIVSCLDAATGKKVWRNESYGTWPQFFTSSSPIIVDGLCVMQLGGRDGAIVAFDLASGEERWKWTDEGSAYASPVLMTLDGAKVIVAETDKSIVALSLADGKALWKTPYAVSGRGYNACTPLVHGQSVIYAGSGRGTKAVAIEKQGDEVTANELWANSETSVQFNSPVLKDGLIVGLTDRDLLFCLTAKDGKTAWTNQLAARGRTRGYGSIVDAGPVLFALTPAAQLLVFEPSDKEYKEIASYRVAESETFAYPVVAGKRIYVKDQDSVTLWAIE